MYIHIAGRFVPYDYQTLNSPRTNDREIIAMHVNNKAEQESIEMYLNNTGLVLMVRCLETFDESSVKACICC